MAGFPASISARVVNRGATEAIARVLVRVDGEVALDSIDVSDGLVKPGQIWSFEPDLPKGVDTKTGAYWVQIRTTSPELVPSLAFRETLWAEGEVQGVRESAYFAPGDFATFALHLSPLDPPHRLPTKVAEGS